MKRSITLSLLLAVVVCAPLPSEAGKGRLRAKGASRSVSRITKSRSIRRRSNFSGKSFRRVQPRSTSRFRRMTTTRRLSPLKNRVTSPLRTVKPRLSRKIKPLGSKLPANRTLKRNTLNKLQTAPNKFGRFKTQSQRIAKAKIKPLKFEKYRGNLKTVLKQNKLQAVADAAAHPQLKQQAVKKLHLQRRCHWWFDVLFGLHFHHHGHVWNYCHRPGYWDCWNRCRWNVIYCPATTVYEASSWYFGVEGVMIPDNAAFGIEAVKANSPADRAGLEPGMMILAANGRAMTDETALAEAIQVSGGRLDLEVLVDGGTELQQVTVILSRVRRVAY